AANSASIVDLATVGCFLADQAIGPPKNRNRYASEDIRVEESSANAASLAPLNISRHPVVP
ncbi:hypothetical protein GcM1_199036, partial [Golovinomyces cichoracearum]